ncbi:MAG: hypothetical protein IJU23_01220 [Proteobacteria bacterium]|nr:hypothetical protein [Pseudomonadota bacterium]
MSRIAGKGIVATANKIVSLCIESRNPDVVAAVTRVSALRLASIRWSQEERLFLEGHFGDGGNAVGFAREIASVKARRFWTSCGMLGRLRALNRCPAFIHASIVDAMALFIANEDCIRTEGLRKVFRFLFGIGDVEFFAALRELVKNGLISLTSVRPNDDMGIGPFVVVFTETGGENWHARWGQSGQKLTWYDLCATDTMTLETALMHSLIECDIDDNPMASGLEIAPYAALDRFYNDGVGTLDDCYSYVCELLEIGSRESCDWSFSHDDAKYCRYVTAIQKAIRRNRNLFHCQSRAEDMGFVYCPPVPDYLQDNQYASEQDCTNAREILKSNIETLRKGMKSGRTVHAEIIRFALDEIPKIFSLKAMYDIFADCDMEPEVIRRNVYALCREGSVIKVGRGLFCSKSYADSHFTKYIKNNAKDNGEFLSEILNEQIQKLEKGLSILFREFEKLNLNPETSIDSEDNEE